MNFQAHTSPAKLERYSFLWSEARLLLGAIALFLGGVPPAIALNPVPALYRLVSALLILAWIISGLAVGYLIYRWNAGGKKLFGGKLQNDMIAFGVMIVTGLNLGIAGLLGINIGMSLLSNRIIFTLVGALYLGTAYYLYKRWKASGEKLF